MTEAPAARAPEPTPSVVAAAPVSEPLEAEAEAAVRRWIGAWRSQDVDGYLASYAPDYARGGRTPAAWADARRARLTSVPWIEIQIDAVTVTPRGPDEATAEFVQRYRDARYADESLKVVLLRRIDGALRIVEESDRVISR